MANLVYGNGFAQLHYFRLLRIAFVPSTSHKQVNYNNLKKLLYRVGQKTDHFLKCITLVCNDIGRRSVYQNIQLFIKSKTDILNVAIFKYSLHKISETILH